MNQNLERHYLSRSEAFVSFNELRAQKFLALPGKTPKPGCEPDSDLHAGLNIQAVKIRVVRFLLFRKAIDHVRAVI